MEKEIFYFGYGTNADKKMMSTIIGRVPCGFKAILKDDGLFIESWKDIPEKAKKILRHSWDEKFKSYIAVPLKNSFVYGMLWRITKKERKMIGEWEINKKWYSPAKVKVVDKTGKIYLAETDIMSKFCPKSFPIQSKNYKHFINSKQKMLKVARKVREELSKN